MKMASRTPVANREPTRKNAPASGAVSASAAVVRPVSVLGTAAHTARPVQVSAAARPLLQRQCACGGSATPAGDCADCRKKKLLQRRPAVPGVAPGTVPPEVFAVLDSPGRPLDGEARAFFEPRFGHEFGRVRIHDDVRAADSAQAVGAEAYAVGEHIVFGAGRYAPGTTEGRRLLAHELVHTIQQRGLQRSSHDLGLPTPPEERVLEQEADIAAERVLAGAPLPRVHESASRPMVSRTPRAWAGTPRQRFTVESNASNLGGQLEFEVTARANEPEGEGVAFLVDQFYLPVNKRFALDRYQERAAAGGLETHLVFRGGNVATARQGDDGTSALTELWFQRRNWPAAQSPQLWHLAGGNPVASGTAAGSAAPAAPTTAAGPAAAVATPAGTAAPTDFPRVGGDVCNVDHILELQLGGNNLPDNMFMLDPGWNQQAGSFIWTQLSGLARQVRAHYYPNDPRPSEITLQFRQVQVHGNPAQSGVPPANWATYDRARCLREVFGGRAGECWRVELCAPHLTAAEIAGAGVAPSATAPGAAATRVYPLRAAEMTANVTGATRGGAEVEVPLSPSAGAVDPANVATADLIAGLELVRLKLRPESSRRRGTGDAVEAVIDQRARAGRGRRTPPSLQSVADEGAIVHLIRDSVRGASEGAPNETEGVLRLSRPREAVRFRYPFLSQVELDVRYDRTAGISGRGTLTPSVPLLNRAPMNLEFGQGRLRAFYSALPRGGRAIPGGRLTEASFGAELLPEFVPSGRLALAFGPADRPFATATLEASADDQGLVFTGTIEARIPGTDRATGELIYRGGEWSGHFVIESSQIRLPGVQRGEVRVDFNPDGTVRPSGTVDLLVAGNPVTLRAAYERSRLQLSGDATVAVPGLRPVTLSLRHDGEHLSGSASTGVTIGGLTGDVTVRYRDGRISGQGTLQLQRGRASGAITLQLSEAGQLFGSGTATVRITDNLIGTVTLEKPERGPVRVTGEMRFPNPITLFRALERNHTLFERTFEFPIPGLSIPIVNVGVIATLTGRLSVGYGFGPGTLHDIHLGVGFNPLEETADLQVDGGAQLDIPAHASLTLAVRAGAGLSIAVARITGGITATGTVGLSGGFHGAVELHYRNSVYEVEAEAAIRMRPVFRLGLDADVTAEVGALGYTAARWQKGWNLAGFEWGAAAEAGLVARVGYHSRNGLRFPEAGAIQWIVPEINPGGIVRDLFTNARGQERDLS